MRIRQVDPGSPLFGRIRPGYSIVSINGREVLDSIDYHFRIADERVCIVFADPNGRKIDFRFEHATADALGLTFDDRKIKSCNCNCIFCFVHQQPRGMRRSLYFKDEDYRLSFTHGNFITLSNITGEDMQRITEQRLSPLYVSVHTTDDELRRSMLRNNTLPPIVPTLRYLTQNRIRIHTQVVLCPGINDGPHLERTISELAGLHPGVETLAIVPVGLTRYRDKLPPLRTYCQKEAAAIVDYVEKRQKEFLSGLGTRFVWPADEFYVVAGRPFPRRHEYENMEQFENGVGMAREFITIFNRRRRRLKRLRSSRRVTLMTGQSAYPFLSVEILPYLRREAGLKVKLAPVSNRFWGETVTVSGLLTGQDLMESAQRMVDECDLLILPPNCLNDDHLFLDDMSLKEFERSLDKPVLVGGYDLAETIMQAFQ
jgi:putative radical SAM enzyme (TIGR03279 family)